MTTEARCKLAYRLNVLARGCGDLADQERDDIESAAYILLAEGQKRGELSIPVLVKKDGLWLQFAGVKTAAIVNLEVVAAGRGYIVEKAIKEWITAALAAPDSSTPTGEEG